MTLVPLVLAGESVRLEPLSLDHHEQLTAAAIEPGVNRWVPHPLTTSDDVRVYIEDALRAREAGTALPFATINQQTGRVIGSTRFGNVDLSNRRVEIGWTFLAAEWQQTKANTEAKYLMLSYAFEKLNCIRVEFKTDALNSKSRQAILRLGAQEEGLLRSHMIVAGGRLRDTVYFSIVEQEWPGVKQHLENKLSQPFAPR